MGRKKDHFNNEDDFDFDEDLGGITFTDSDAEEIDAFTEPPATEYYDRKGRKKKKKRKKKRYLLKFLIFLLVLAAVFVFLRSDFFTIEKIDVINNSHYTEEQIIKITGIKTGDNLFEFTSGKLKKRLTADPYIETAEIKRKIPDTLTISVTERVEKIVVPYEEKFIVTDYEGMILRLADKAPDLTVINNLEPKDPKPGTALEVSETQILTDTLNLLKGVEEEGLYFKSINVSQHTVKAYIYDNLTVEGNYDNISKNLDKLSVVINDLHKKKVKRGTIKMSGSITFQPEIDDKKN